MQQSPANSGDGCDPDGLSRQGSFWQMPLQKLALTSVSKWMRGLGPVWWSEVA